MKNHKIKVEAFKVQGDSGICPGEAKVKESEEFVLGARTPAENPICTNALMAIQPMALAMKLTNKMYWEKNEYFDLVCPHGAVTFRISRIRENDDSAN